MDLMIKLMKSENEENALICIKIMIDGFRAHRVGHPLDRVRMNRRY